MDKAFITQLSILKMSNIKPNFSELARLYGIDRRTVKKYYDGYDGKPSHRNKPSKLDKHLDVIKTKLLIRGATIRAVFEFIIDEIDPDIGTYSNFNKYVRAKGLKPLKTPKGHPRYETRPGLQAQVDWKEDMKLTNKFGETFIFQVFDYKLGYSRYPIFIYKLHKTRQDVFDCLIEAFKLTGGIPEEILFDNMSSVVDRDGNKINISNMMNTFAKDFAFKIKLCKPRHPFTKGKVEAMNKFLSWLYPYQNEFETEEELIDILKSINKKICNRVCDETGIQPILLFQKEKEYLKPLPSKEIIESYLSTDRQTTVRKDSMITYSNNKYSVPAEYIGKPVTIRIFENNLQIYYNTDLISEHKISSKKLNYKSDHYKQLLEGSISPENLDDIAESNLRQMDQFL